MIASENFVPQAVLDAAGSVVTNKPVEGYPGRRYYGGCVEVDVAEQLAIDRAKALCGAEHANVQPYAIPFDERPPMSPSGLRIGTPSLTTRGLVEDDLRELAEVIGIAL